jgi:hypothetical protein
MVVVVSGEGGQWIWGCCFERGEEGELVSMQRREEDDDDAIEV